MRQYKKLLIILALPLLLVSCNKKYNDEPYNPPQPEQANTVYQSFGVTIGTGTSQMTAKGWDAQTWVYKFSPDPATLILTGTGASVGQNYIVECTVAELKSGTVAINMLPGTYKATYTTPHKMSVIPFVLNGKTLADLINAPQIGDVLDIKIDNSFTITGTPLNLTATLDDCLIIVDIPNELQVQVSKTNDFTGSIPRLANTYLESDKYHFGYTNSGVWLKLLLNSKMVDGTGWLKGNSYHLITNFSAQSSLMIPDMIVNTVIVP